jgi:uridine kinase
MAVKAPFSGSAQMLEKVQARLGPDRLPLLIAIDGPDGLGKSSLASWLAWQLGTPAIYLDLYVIKGSEPLQWRTEELSRVVSERLDNRRKPVVVEGIMILDALRAIDRKPDFLVYLRGEGSYALSDRLRAYRARCQPEQRADFCLQGFVEH